jgi:hypothetical protein
MEVVRSSETSVHIRTRRYIPEDGKKTKQRQLGYGRGGGGHIFKVLRFYQYDQYVVTIVTVRNVCTLEWQGEKRGRWKLWGVMQLSNLDTSQFGE